MGSHQWVHGTLSEPPWITHLIRSGSSERSVGNWIPESNKPVMEQKKVNPRNVHETMKIGEVVLGLATSHCPKRCRYVYTPMLSGLRWPGQTNMGSWPPAESSEYKVKSMKPRTCKVTLNPTKLNIRLNSNKSHAKSNLSRSFTSVQMFHTHTHEGSNVLAMGYDSASL